MTHEIFLLLLFCLLGCFVLFCFSVCSSYFVSSSKFEVDLKILKVLGISVVRPISVGYGNPNAWARDCSEGWDFVLSTTTALWPTRLCNAHWIQPIHCLCSQVFPSGNACWGVTQAEPVSSWVRNGSLCCYWVVFQIRSRIKDFFFLFCLFH